MRRRVWSEFLPFDEFRRPQTLRLLGTHDVEPILAVHVDADLQSLAETIRAAKKAGLRPWIWPLLAKDHGYWASEQNSGEWRARVDAILKTLESENARPSGVAVDLEPPLEIVNLTRSMQVMEWMQLVRRHLDPIRFESSVRSWQTIASSLNSRGYETLGITTPMAAHDLGDGQPVWQDLLETPWIDVPWSSWGIMAYNSMVAGYSKGVLNIEEARACHHPLLVRMNESFGPRGHVSLGLTGTGVLEDEAVYSSPDDLALDVAAAKAAGIMDIGVFCLEGILDHSDPESWLRKFDVPPAVLMPQSWKTPLVQGAARSARFVTNRLRKLEIRR